MYQPKVEYYAVYEPPEESWQDWEDQSRQIYAGLESAGLEIVSSPEKE
jgi:hypothetical protein